MAKFPATPPHRRPREQRFLHEVWRCTIHGEVMSTKNGRIPIAEKGESGRQSFEAMLKNAPPLPPSKGNFKVLPSKQAKRWKLDAAPQFNVHSSAFRAVVAKHELAAPYFVGFRFVRVKNAIFDFPNLCQGCMDLMTAAGWWEDDNASQVYPLPLPYLINAREPGVDLVLFAEYPLLG